MYNCQKRMKRNEREKRNVLKCVNGTELKRVETITYLGIIIDDKLRFKNHCKYILKRKDKKMSFLNRLRQYVLI